MERLSLEEAQNLILSHVEKMQLETVNVIDAAGRVTARDLTSDIDVCPFDNSAMDGFAFRASQIEGATEDNPVELKVVAEVGAGDVYDGDTSDDECIRIMTGAALPSCCDSMQMWEKTENVSGNGKIGSIVRFSSSVKKGNNIRFAGEDAKAGEIVAHAGDKITTGGVGYLASCGVLQVETYARPKVAIISTGSELVTPDVFPERGKIRESNAHAIAACAKSVGAVPVVMPIVADDLEEIKKAILEASQQSDFVVTSGGASGGDFDYIEAAIESLGELYMTEVCMRPGKAQVFGVVNNTPVLGLAGNPAAAFCGFEMLTKPALLSMQGHTSVFKPKVKAKIEVDFTKKVVRRYFMRAKLTYNEESGVASVMPAKHQSSALFCELQACNALCIIPENNEPIHAGDYVDCILID